jgi:hypothetical protein
MGMFTEVYSREVDVIGAPVVSENLDVDSLVYYNFSLTKKLKVDKRVCFTYFTAANVVSYIRFCRHDLEF